VKPLIWLIAALISPGHVLAADPVPDFKLTDLNEGSPRRLSLISPRDYILQVSGYYFGNAT
jgi:hypothetical protein